MLKIRSLAILIATMTLSILPTNASEDDAAARSKLVSSSEFSEVEIDLPAKKYQQEGTPSTPSSISASPPSKGSPAAQWVHTDDERISFYQDDAGKRTANSNTGGESDNRELDSIPVFQKRCIVVIVVTTTLAAGAAFGLIGWTLCHVYC
jgi:hypothetical protein